MTLSSSYNFAEDYRGLLSVDCGLFKQRLINL